MKKIMSNPIRRKLALRSESIQVLSVSQLGVAVAGLVPVPPQQPHSALNGCTGTIPPFN